MVAGLYPVKGRMSSSCFGCRQVDKPLYTDLTTCSMAVLASSMLIEYPMNGLFMVNDDFSLFTAMAPTVVRSSSVIRISVTDVNHFQGALQRAAQPELSTESPRPSEERAADRDWCSSKIILVQWITVSRPTP